MRRNGVAGTPGGAGGMHASVAAQTCRRFDLSQLRSFVMVAQEGHLTRAAEWLHLSQPAVSGHIKSLEDELACALFLRLPMGVALTRAGEALLGDAERVLEAVGGLYSHARLMAGDASGRVRLGTIIDPEYLRLGQLLRILIERLPRLEIETFHGISGWVRDSVALGTLDAGFMLGENEDASVETVLLARVPYRIVAPPAWRAQIEAADWGDVACLPWVWTTEKSSHNRVVTEIFRRRGSRLSKKVIVADQESTMKTLVTAGVGVSLMREDLAELAEANAEVVIWRRAELELPLSFIFRHERKADPLIDVLVLVLAEIWTGADTVPSVERTVQVQHCAP